MIIPSIDIMNGIAVQLENGERKVLEETDLQKLVNKFKIFPETNVIDLDAALSQGQNKELIKSLCKKLPCTVGGGIRSKEVAEEYLRAGAKKIIIGTAATKDFLKGLPSHRIIVALDMKGGKIAIEGWRKTVEYDLSLRIKELEKYCSGFLITNVDVEGLNKGTNMEFIQSLKNLTSKKIIVAGGISSYEEIKAIDKLGFDQVLGMSIYTGKIDLHKALVSLIDFSKSSKGLVPTIVQNETGKVLMLAYSNKESMFATLKTKHATYFSRSRSELWEKGLTSGNVQELISVKYDCDADTLLYTVKQTGAACHTGSYSCFEKKEFSIEYLLGFLENRINSSEMENSYTKKIAQSDEKLHKKIIEEAFEITQAKQNGRGNQIWELADLLYFMLVYMAKHGISLDEVKNELSMRHKSEV